MNEVANLVEKSTRTKRFIRSYNLFFTDCLVFFNWKNILSRQLASDAIRLVRKVAQNCKIYENVAVPFFWIRRNITIRNESDN